MGWPTVWPASHPEGWGPGTPLHVVVLADPPAPPGCWRAAVVTCLALSGAVMQAIVQNPLADPMCWAFPLGASLGASLALLLGIGGGFVGCNGLCRGFGRLRGG